jgi:hypothetical protein
LCLLLDPACHPNRRIATFITNVSSIQSKKARNVISISYAQRVQMPLLSLALLNIKVFLETICVSPKHHKNETERM